MYAQTTTKGKGIGGKIERGRQIFLERGGEIEHVAGQSYLVPSLSRESLKHAVSVTPGECRCSCESFRYEEQPCLHIYAAGYKAELPAGYSIERKYGRFGYVYALAGPGGERRGLHLSLGEAIDFSRELVGEVATDG